MDLDPTALMEQIKNPTMGVQILAVMTLVNVVLGILLASRADDFNRRYLMSFLRTRVVEQLAPIAGCGLGSLWLNMPWLLSIYLFGAGAMLISLIGDIKEKAVQLWSKP
jgi:hypothetical protein